MDNLFNLKAAKNSIACQQLSFGRLVRETTTKNTIIVKTFDFPEEHQPDSFESTQSQNGANPFPQAHNNQQLPPALAVQLLAALQQVQNFFLPRASQPAQQMNYVA